MKIKQYFIILLMGLSIVSCNTEEESDKELPSLSNLEATLILRNSVQCRANIDIIGSGPITACGVCWGEEASPTLDNNFAPASSVDEIVVTISGLKEASSYYIRAYATNQAGTAYSSALAVNTLKSPEKGKLSDFDGNTYTTVLIGDTWWMAENLKVAHYRNGDEIPNISDDETWMNPKEGYSCYYGNARELYGPTYGAIYNYLVVSDERDLCPDEWHVPTLEEWKCLDDYCGGESSTPLKLIEPKSNWLWPTGFETNETGFNALGGGYRDAGANFGKLNEFGEWWASDTVSMFEFGSVHLSNQGFNLESYYYSYGKSIRCVKATKK
jgi:uncharacterized protein (TIGR02145 family)